jgi:hypothetical protein
MCCGLRDLRHPMAAAAVHDALRAAIESVLDSKYLIDRQA